jgi:crotonobetainyl-CoA:carnitine CoA-transferase CaiB-like acyl-CoA transferase
MPRLAGIRIVTIAINAPGPLAASRLRDAGATVFKIEPTGGDPMSEFCPAWYEELSAGMQVERLDLKSEAGQSRIRALLRDADLFLASQRPSALQRLRLDANTLLDSAYGNAKLRWLNIVGDTANPEVAGHDLTYLAQAGLLGRDIPRTLVADVLGAEHAFATSLLLLHDSPGAQAVVGLYDALAPLVAPLAHGLTRPGGRLGGGLNAYGQYDTKEGRIAIAALEPHFRSRLYAALGVEPDADLAPTFKSRTAVDWESWAVSLDLPLCAVKE